MEKQKSAAIYLHGLDAIGDPKTSIKTVKFTEESQLIAHLKDLQRGYCEEGTSERPKIAKHMLPTIRGGKRLVIDCYTSADWHYVAHVGFSLKAETGKPIEILN